MSRNSLSVREATAEDYRQVMAIDEGVYQGFDYLPSVYLEMVHDKFTYMFVGEIRREVVGFVAMRLIQNSTTVVSVAIRSSKKVRKTGFAAIFKAMAINELKKKWPSPQQLIVAVPTGPFPKYWDNILADPSQQDNILLIWNFIAYEFERNILEQILKTQTGDTVAFERVGSTVSKTDISGIVKLLREEGEYFHHDYWVVQPVTEKCTRYVINTSNVYVTRGPNSEIAAVSHASILKLDSCTVRMDIWFHGHSKESCLAHVLSFLKDMKLVISSTTKTFRMMLHHPMAMGQNSMEDYLAHILGPRYAMPPTFGRTLALLHKSQL